MVSFSNQVTVIRNPETMQEEEEAQMFFSRDELGTIMLRCQKILQGQKADDCHRGLELVNDFQTKARRKRIVRDVLRAQRRHRVQHKTTFLVSPGGTNHLLLSPQSPLSMNSSGDEDIDEALASAARAVSSESLKEAQARAEEDAKAAADIQQERRVRFTSVTDEKSSSTTKSKSKRTHSPTMCSPRSGTDRKKHSSSTKKKYPTSPRPGDVRKRASSSSTKTHGTGSSSSNSSSSSSSTNGVKQTQGDMGKERRSRGSSVSSPKRREKKSSSLSSSSGSSSRRGRRVSRQPSLNRGHSHSVTKNADMVANQTRSVSPLKRSHHVSRSRGAQDFGRRRSSSLLPSSGGRSGASSARLPMALPFVEVQ